MDELDWNYLNLFWIIYSENLEVIQDKMGTGILFCFFLFWKTECILGVLSIYFLEELEILKGSGSQKKKKD